MALGPSFPNKRPRLEKETNGGSQSGQSQFFTGGRTSQTDCRRLKEERKHLPVFPVKDELLVEIAKSPTLILIGETGSGKTTQIPQFIYEANMHGDNGIIGITQPRRVAAVSLSMRVAEEMGVELGNEVGYSVRFDTLCSERTNILYLTDGMLLREAISDPALKRYSVIFLDEAHERTLHTDVMFSIVKAAQQKRKQRGSQPLKIIIMSASMDVDHFSAYFDNAPVVYVEGRQYPVNLFYTAQDSSDYVHDTIVAIFQLHQKEPTEYENGILAFLTGQDEIDQVVSKCREVARELPSTCHKMTIMPLYAAQSPRSQLRVFDSCQGSRKVVIATNIAETSLTIPGIRIVIDAGKVKSRVYDASRGIDMLKVSVVSKAQACQRTGRAGRDAPGACYRLYTEAAYESLKQHTMPEILRCNLSGIVLELLALRISNVQNFDFMDKPKAEAIESAIKQLNFLGAVDEVEQPSASSSAPTTPSLLLTQMGNKMATFALDPQLSRMLLASADLQCTADMLGVVAIMSTDNFLLSPASKKEESEAARRKYFSPEGDLLTLFNMFRAYRQAKGSGKEKQWCSENFINSRVISVVEKVREQLRDVCIRLGLPVNASCGQNTAILRRAICYGLFMNAAELDPSGDGYRLVESGLKALIHPSSCLFHHKPEYILYSELVLTSQLYMRDVTVVDPKALLEAAPDYFKHKHVA